MTDKQIAERLLRLERVGASEGTEADALRELWEARRLLAACRERFRSTTVASEIRLSAEVHAFLSGEGGKHVG